MGAASDLGAATVAVFPYEDRNSMHRLKAERREQVDVGNLIVEIA